MRQKKIIIILNIGFFLGLFRPSWRFRKWNFDPYEQWGKPIVQASYYGNIISMHKHTRNHNYEYYITLQGTPKMRSSDISKKEHLTSIQ